MSPDSERATVLWNPADRSTEWFQEHLELDHNVFMKTGGALWEPMSPFAASRQGLFAIGEVLAGSIKRAVAAVGEGSVAISDIHRYLEKLEAAGSAGREIRDPAPINV